MLVLEDVITVDLLQLEHVFDGKYLLWALAQKDDFCLGSDCHKPLEETDHGVLSPACVQSDGKNRRRYGRLQAWNKTLTFA